MRVAKAVCGSDIRRAAISAGKFIAARYAAQLFTAQLDRSSFLMPKEISRAGGSALVEEKVLGEPGT